MQHALLQVLQFTCVEKQMQVWCSHMHTLGLDWLQLLLDHAATGMTQAGILTATCCALHAAGHPDASMGSLCYQKVGRQDVCTDAICLSMAGQAFLWVAC